ncbi:MAG: hypothetical protein BGN97_04490 [Microbacterium sp. 69-10]|uniref:hypothetical protein n=1 Tax=Microbacterium sp. 69-10 TaxID=1895783 RepID=UPI00096A0451|nr:hypothetical protein [Microbacterium sp. 69-10]OJU42018.1 MAG: hypothetical protein BGN97_04490 [Microbacterium sp. 69-10]
MLDVRNSRELQATILALRGAQRQIRTGINKEARSRIRPLWQQALNARARDEMTRRIIVAGARATASDRGVTVHAATRRRPLSGGLVPAFEWAGAEFGARTKRIEVTQRSRAGRSYKRPLTINRQFHGRQQDGMVAFDAASEVGTKIVALWVHTVVDELTQIPAVEVVA